MTEGETATFTVTLNNPVEGQDVTVSFETVSGTATAGEDYVVSSGEWTFAAGEIEHTISVTTIDDTVKREGNENFFLRLTGLNSPQGEGTIADNDGKGGGGKGGGPKKNATSITSTDLTDAAFGSLGADDDAPQATSSSLFDRRGSGGGGEENDDEELLP